MRRISETVFLNVHVESVQKDFAVGTADPFGKRNPFRRGVHDELLEAIDHLDAKDDAAVFSGFDRFAHTFDRTVSQNSFVFVRCQFARPGTVIDARHDGAPQIFHGSRDVLKKGDPLFAGRGILRGKVHVVFQANAVGQAEARIFGGAFERVPLLITHAG